MDTTGYVTLSRQSGLLREMQIVANNIANTATTGYRQQGLVFSEYVQSAPGQSSVSMTRAQVRNTSLEQGTLTQTNGTYDLAVQGRGFFLLQTEAGERLTRAGSFSPNAEGELVSVDGHQVLDIGGAPVFVPGGVAQLRIAGDGTISADGRPLGQIGLFVPTDPDDLGREDGVMFAARNGVEPAEQATILQGFLEASNVNAILQVSRMIEIQRAYEMGQSFLETEDQRIRNAVKTLIR